MTSVRPTKAAPKKSGKKPPVVTPAEGPTVSERVRPKTEAVATEEPTGAEAILYNVKTACYGNPFLEAMVLGEILNSPRF